MRVVCCCNVHSYFTPGDFILYNYYYIPLVINGFLGLDTFFTDGCMLTG